MSIPSKEIIFPDSISSNAVTWLQAKQPAFTEALAEFGLKTRLQLGFERNRDPFLGQFTGAGLCAIASGIAEAALKRKFGDSVTTCTYFFHTLRRDIDTYENSESMTKAIAHWILGFKTRKGNEISYFADPTYRQFLITVDPNRMLIGISADRINDLYAVNKIYAEAVRQNPNNYGLYKPKVRYNGILHRSNIADLNSKKAAWLDGVTEKDYMKLMEAFI